MIEPRIAVLRPRQWIKNGFVAVPFFFGQRMEDLSSNFAMVAAVVFFCLLSSAVYVFNDINDRKADAAHAKKRIRPIASGAVRVGEACVIIVVLLAAAALVGAAVRLPVMFYAAAGIYAVFNIGYSLGLKAIPILELFLVASGFVIRLFAGGSAAEVSLTTWVVACTGLLALLMTAGKRRADIVQLNDVTYKRHALEDYSVEFLDRLIVMFATATFMTYMLFTMSDYAFERFSNLVPLSALFVGYGLCRYLYLVTVRKDGDAPTDMVIRDNGIRISVALFVTTFAFMIYWHQP